MCEKGLNSKKLKSMKVEVAKYDAAIPLWETQILYGGP